MTVMTMNREALTYYAKSGPFTDLSAHGARVRDLARTLPELCQVVQGLIVHPFHAELYGLAPNALRQDEVQIRSASAMLDRILALDPRPLSDPRPPARRFVGKRESHRITFDPLDVPRTQFLVGGDAWQRCRRGGADPERFGILDMHGLWFVLQNLVRDLAARAKRELLPWDGWGVMLDRERYDDPAVLALLDRVAELTQAGDERHAQISALHDSEPRLRVPRKIVSFGPGGGATVDLGLGVA
jgi:hypothetical protein